MSDKNDPSAKDYRATLFLPQTDFPMKAGLPAAEPKWLARWAELDLYGAVRAKAKGRPQFVLHDGPPYANGEIHSGTGLNKILKDFVVRSQTMMGKDAPYVPGWDCHGLPIEWKVEEKIRKTGKTKDDVPVIELRQMCRDFAKGWIDKQRAQFKRLGVWGLWDKPYLTMNYAAEATIAGELHKFVETGLLYRGFRPVMWSPVEKTALAEAEVEYQDRESTTIYVKFPVTAAASAGAAVDLGVEPLSVVIWTTTPWTIPANRAIAFSPTMDYAVYAVTAVEEGSLAKVGEKIVLADALADTVARHAKMTVKRTVGIDPAFLTCAHPLRGLGYEFDVKLYPGDHVTADTGTGFVHTAPGHGEDDFALMLAVCGKDYPAKHPDAFNTVNEEGALTKFAPGFEGLHILSRDGKKEGDANKAVIAKLAEVGALLATGKVRHSYPHSWRSKAPVIFRATPQWFAAMDKPFRDGKTLRELALKGLSETEFYPAAGANRIGSMVEGRPDWVLSRQRAWGVPLALFVEKATGKILDDKAVNARIVAAFKDEGADAWFKAGAAERFLGPDRDPNDFEQVKDILDVWFDSGSTHVFTVEAPVDPAWPQADKIDLYLEGSDQHRGWFQSSLLESCATRGEAPYKAILTHGFVLDEKGRKMSKSLGNTVLPQTICDQNGADILRLWAASSDFTQDLRIGADIVKSNVDAYRRLRNTIRFMLANLAGFEDDERIDPVRMPELERYILAKLAEIDVAVREAYTAYDFNRVYNTVFSFVTNELSAFYFDIRKDALYCDAKSAVRRRSARTVADAVFKRVATWLAPILCFTMEEAWLTRYPDAVSVHLEDFPATPAGWADADLIAKWDRIRALRRVVTGALEIARRDKAIGASLEAAPMIFVEDKSDYELLKGIDAAEITITSKCLVNYAPGPAQPAIIDNDTRKLASQAFPSGGKTFSLPDVPGVHVLFAKAEGHKCARCWMILPEVDATDELCPRCRSAVAEGEKTA